MIILTGKIVFVKTQEEYLSVLKMAKLQGFTWAKENHLNPIVIPFPNILNFYDSKIVTYNYVKKTVYEASEIVEDEEKIKDAVKLVRTFAKSPDRTALTDQFIESLKLLADTVESQMEEVKQMERLTKWEDGSITYNEKRELECGEYCDSCSQGAGNCKTVENMIKKLATYEDLEEQGLLVRLPCKVGTEVYYILGIPNKTPCAIDKCVFKLSDIDKIGESLFLTHKETEKKLEELKNEI